MSKISIAIPTYNRKDYLNDCLLSIQAQTEKDFTVYIFDNNSDYNIEEFLANFKQHLQIIIIKNPQNTGNLNNFSRIFAHQFNSEYLVVFHDDDTMHPSFLEKNMQQMELRREAVLIGSEMNFVSEHANMTKFIDFTNPNVRVLNQREFVQDLMSGFNLCFGSVMYRVAFVDKNFSIFGQKYYKWCDRPYVIELLKNGPGILLKNKLVNYRVHPGQDSQLHSKNNRVELMELFLLYRDIFVIGNNVIVDQKKYLIYSTNYLLMSSFSFADNIKDYVDFIRVAQSKYIFKFKYIRIRGIYYIIKGIIKIIMSNFGSFHK